MVSVSLAPARTAPARSSSVRNAPAPSARVWRRVTSTMHGLPIHPSRRSHGLKDSHFACHIQPTVNRNASKVELARQGGGAQLYEEEFIRACAFSWLARAFSVGTPLSLTAHEPLNMLMQINT